MYAVVVNFQIKDGAMAAFLPLMIENARVSLAEEPGCLRFDVCTDRAQPDTVLLYELYTDRAAFDAHLESAHFKAFYNRAANMLLERDVRTFDRVMP